MASPSSNRSRLVGIPPQHRASQHQKPAIDISGMTFPAFVIRHDFDDVDELGVVARAWDLDFRQLNRGGFRGSVVHAGTANFQVSRTRLQGVLHQHGSSPAGLRTFAIAAGEDIHLRWRGHDVEQNQILVFPRSCELESTSNPDFDMMLVSLKEDHLEAARQRLGLAGSEEVMAEMEITCCQGAVLAQLRQWILGALDVMTQDPTCLDDAQNAEHAKSRVSDLIVRAVVTARCEHGRHRSARRRRLVEHAVRLAHDNAKDIQSVAELSRESGASVRTLRRGFQERFGVSPKAYLEAQRLNGARRDLRSADQRSLVTDVANSWGFWHMGQFAADYRKMFGELPSQTVRVNGRGS